MAIHGTAPKVPKDPIWKKKGSEDAFAKNAENGLLCVFCWIMLDLNSYISIVCILCIICLYMIYRCVCTQRILRSMEYPKSKSPACIMMFPGRLSFQHWPNTSLFFRAARRPCLGNLWIIELPRFLGSPISGLKIHKHLLQGDPSGTFIPVYRRERNDFRWPRGAPHCLCCWCLGGGTRACARMTHPMCFCQMEVS